MSFKDFTGKNIKYKKTMDIKNNLKSKPILGYLTGRINRFNLNNSSLLKKAVCLVLFSFLSVYNVNSQDIIILTTGEEIKAVVKEISSSKVSYYRYDNQNGPLYHKETIAVFQIKYENGYIDTFNKNIVMLDDELLEITTKNPTELLKKGNKVFVEIPDEASRAGEKYFIEELRNWGYWTVVDDVTEAHFIIVFNIDKKAMLDKTSWAVIKTRDNKEIKKTKTYRATTNAFNGYNAFRAAAIKLVDKYFKKEFK